MATPSKTGNLDANGALKVSLAADTAVATTFVDVTNTAQKLPGTPLENRREVILAFPTDSVYIGPSGHRESHRVRFPWTGDGRGQLD